jgi:LDH2 family malate/lactate/ureidoglycolate dehydrogenase
MMASADPIGGIAPKGRMLGVFGTNPLSISIPYKRGDITLDMSTAKYTWGDLISADTQHKKLEKGFAFDKTGEETTNPREAMKGTVNSFDGSYKGLGLAFMIQILAGALVGSTYEQNDETCDYGSLIMAIDPERLGGMSFMQSQIEKMVHALKNDSTDDSIFLPGEQGDMRYKNNLKSGTIPIDVELLAKIHRSLLNK